MLNKKQSLVRNAYNFGVTCSILALLLLPSCCLTEACSCDPCNDGVYCNGIEPCVIDGGLSRCIERVPRECEEGMVCNEEARACVPE